MTGTVPSGASTLAASSETSCNVDQSTISFLPVTQRLSPGIAAHLVEVDGGSEGVGGQLVVVPHTDLTEVTRMVLYSQ
jgi:hypothetical protein